MISRLKMKLAVRVVVLFMLLEGLDMLVVAAVRYAAQYAKGKQKNSTGVILVASVAKKICKGCSSDQKARGAKPRELTKLPIEVTQSGIFQNKGLGVWLCEHCDQQELELALATHEKRIDNK